MIYAFMLLLLAVIVAEGRLIVKLIIRESDRILEQLYKNSNESEQIKD